MYYKSWWTPARCKVPTDRAKENQSKVFRLVPTPKCIKHNSVFLPLLVVLALLQASCFLVHNCIICKLLLICGCFSKNSRETYCILFTCCGKAKLFSPCKPTCANPLLDYSMCFTALYLYEVVDLHARCDYANLYSSPFSLLTFSLKYRICNSHSSALKLQFLSWPWTFLSHYEWSLFFVCTTH